MSCTEISDRSSICAACKHAYRRCSAWHDIMSCQQAYITLGSRLIEACCLLSCRNIFNCLSICAACMHAYGRCRLDHTHAWLFVTHLHAHAQNSRLSALSSIQCVEHSRPLLLTQQEQHSVCSDQLQCRAATDSVGQITDTWVNIVDLWCINAEATFLREALWLFMNVPSAVLTNSACLACMFKWSSTADAI